MIAPVFTACAGFESARRLPGLPVGHRSRGTHGHGFVATVRAPLPEGWASFPGGETDALRDALRAAVAPLDHVDLNRVLANPDDGSLARHLRAALPLPAGGSVGVRSNAQTGVEIDDGGRALAWRRYRFLSAHRLPNVPPGHKCGRMHGHGFEAVLHVSGVDHDTIDRCWAPVHDELDHACLNDLPGLDNPTSEMLSAWIWARLTPRLPGLVWVTVHETGSCGAVYDGSHYRIWKELTIDSAVRLAKAPDGDPRRRLHGDTFMLRLHLNAPLDALTGWTIDFGDVKTLFDPIFRSLDHHPLPLLDRITDNDPASIAAWVLARAQPLLPALERVDLLRSDASGVLLGAGTPVLAV